MPGDLKFFQAIFTHGERFAQAHTVSYDTARARETILQAVSRLYHRVPQEFNGLIRNIEQGPTEEFVFKARKRSHHRYPCFVVNMMINVPLFVRQFCSTKFSRGIN